MDRTATKMKTARRQRPVTANPRVKAGRRHGQSIVEETSSLPRPANDVGIELGLPEPPMAEAAFAAVVEDMAPELEPIEAIEAEAIETIETVVAVSHEEEELEVELVPIPEEETEEDAEEEEEEVVARPAGPEGEVKKSEEPQSFLSMYFRDMAELEVLRPEQEFETARRIEELELGLWRAVLSFTSWAGHAVDTVEKVIGKPLPEFKPYQALAEKAGHKSSTPTKKKFEKMVEALAVKLKELDIDRVFVDAALSEIHRLDGAAKMGRPIDGLDFQTNNKTFRQFVDAVSAKATVVKLAKNEFVKANLRLVVSIARRFNHGRLPLPDLIQEGNIGLMKAVERYDYRRGFRFSTYASWWIRHAISRALADKGRAVRLPVHMIDAYHRIAKSERELQSKLERPATTEEIASVTGIEAEKLEKMRTFLADNPVSLDRSLSDDDGRRLIDVLVDPNEAPSPPDQMMSSETQREMLKLLSVLKPIEADILRKRFGLVNDRERTLKEIGDEYRLSRERVRQLQEQALGKMRKAMAKREML
jgi:RNA polymerase primary sigma factor